MPLSWMHLDDELLEPPLPEDAVPNDLRRRFWSERRADLAECRMSATTPPPLPPPASPPDAVALVLVHVHELCCASVSEELIVSGSEHDAFCTECFESTSPSAVSVSTCGSSERRPRSGIARLSAPGSEDEALWRLWAVSITLCRLSDLLSRERNLIVKINLALWRPNDLQNVKLIEYRMFDEYLITLIDYVVGYMRLLLFLR